MEKLLAGLDNDKPRKLWFYYILISAFDIVGHRLLQMKVTTYRFSLTEINWMNS